MAAKKAPATDTRADSKPEPTKADEKRLVRDVELAEKEVDQARALVKEAEGKLSFAIKAISDAFGSGPFEIRGKRVNISSRNETYFFKGEKQSVRQLG
jgi:hypothetical protein